MASDFNYLYNPRLRHLLSIFRSLFLVKYRLKEAQPLINFYKFLT